MTGLACVHFNPVTAARGLLRSSISRQSKASEGFKKRAEGPSNVNKPGLHVARTAECNRRGLRSREINYDRNLRYTVKDFHSSWPTLTPVVSASCLKTALMAECELSSGLRIAFDFHAWVCFLQHVPPILHFPLFGIEGMKHR